MPLRASQAAHLKINETVTISSVFVKKVRVPNEFNIRKVRELRSLAFLFVYPASHDAQVALRRRGQPGRLLPAQRLLQRHDDAVGHQEAPGCQAPAALGA